MATENTSTPEVSTAVPPPRVPKYVKLIWQALNGISRSAEVKTDWARLIARQFTAFADTSNRAVRLIQKACCDPAKTAPANMAERLARAEKIGLLAMCLDMDELKLLTETIFGLLEGDLTITELNKAINTC